MNTPLSVRWIRWLAFAELCFAVLFAIGIVLAAGFPSDHGFFRGFEEAIAKSAGHARSLEEFGPEQAGQATFQLVLAFVFPALVLTFLRQRRRTGLIVTLAISIVLALGQKQLPLLAVVQLVLSLTGSAARFLTVPVVPPLPPSQESIS